MRAHLTVAQRALRRGLRAERRRPGAQARWQRLGADRPRRPRRPRARRRARDGRRRVNRSPEGVGGHRARAGGPLDRALRVRLRGLDGLRLADRLEHHPAGQRASCRRAPVHRPRQLPGGLRDASLLDQRRVRERRLHARVRGRLHRCWGCCWRSSSTSRSAANRSSGASSCSRWRSRSWSPARSGRGSSTRPTGINVLLDAVRSSTTLRRALLDVGRPPAALEASSTTLRVNILRPGLTADPRAVIGALAHRRDLADVGLRDGALPRRAARRLRRAARGRRAWMAPRRSRIYRHIVLPLLRPITVERDRAAGLHVAEDVRPRLRAHEGRPGARRATCPRSSCSRRPSRATSRRRARPSRC